MSETVFRNSIVLRPVAGSLLTLFLLLLGFPVESDQGRRYGSVYRTARTRVGPQRLDSADVAHHGADDAGVVEATPQGERITAAAGTAVPPGRTDAAALPATTAALHGNPGSTLADRPRLEFHALDPHPPSTRGRAPPTT